MGLFDDIGSSVSNIGKDVGNSFSSGGTFSDIGNFVSQGVKSLGNYYGFDNKGKWTNSGGVFKWMDEGLGQITGRNQSRAAMNQAGDQFNQTQQQAKNLITQQRWNNQQADVLASNSAGAASKASSIMSGANYTNSTPLATGPGFSGGGGGQKDFLGL